MKAHACFAAILVLQIGSILADDPSEIGSGTSRQIKNQILAKELSAEYSKELQALDQPSFCEKELDSGRRETYRVFWSRAFDPPLIATIIIEKDGSVFSTLTEINAHPLEGKIHKRVKTWVDVCQSQAERLEEDPAEYCEDYIEALRKIADEGFWSVSPEVELGIVLDGSYWVIEGRRGESCRVVTRWSPSPESPVFRFAWFVVGATEKRLYFDEVY